MILSAYKKNTRSGGGGGWYVSGKIGRQLPSTLTMFAKWLISGPEQQGKDFPLHRISDDREN